MVVAVMSTSSQVQNIASCKTLHKSHLNVFESDVDGRSGYLQNTKCTIQRLHKSHLSVFEGDVDGRSGYLQKTKCKIQRLHKSHLNVFEGGVGGRSVYQTPSF